MDYRSYEKRLEYILELLEKGRFGSLQNAAKRFSVSTRTVKRMLSHLRDNGHKIEFDRPNNKYFLKREE